MEWWWRRGCAPVAVPCLSLFFLFLLLLLLLAPAAFGQTASCADFLAAQRRKPPGLEWTGCAEGHLHQLRALTATYRVPGAQAAAVERYLARHTGMARLHFVCCGWEPRSRHRGREGAGSLPGPQGLAYRVSMHSGETLVTRRGGWGAIPWFEVSVVLPLEPP
ncbi:hypothetical protein GmRootA79_27990 [Acidovorax sp. A79]